MYNPKKISIQKIFFDHWDTFLRDPGIIRRGLRPIVIQEVEKMMACGTINERLRDYFLRERKLLNVLFASVKETLFYVFHNMNGRSHTFKPGFILTLHTFERALNFHPHIHCLLTEGGMDEEKMTEWCYAEESDFLIDEGDPESPTWQCPKCYEETLEIYIVNHYKKDGNASTLFT